MRIAYLITAYRDLVQLRRLTDAIRRGDPDALVHIQFDCSSPHLKEARDFGAELHQTAHPVHWGDGSYTHAILDSFRALRRREWDWVVVLSGQDYPVRPLSLLRDQLTNGCHTAYLEGSAVSPSTPLPLRTFYVDRYTYQYRWIQRQWTPRWRHALASNFAEFTSRGLLRVQTRPRGLGPGIGIRRRRVPFSTERPCWFGSDYFALSRPTIARMLQLLEQEPRVLRYFSRTFIPSESLFGSVARWVDGDRVSPTNFHFMQFHGNANPRILVEEDVEIIRQSGAIFARKFDDGSTWVERAFPLRD